MVYISLVAGILISLFYLARKGHSNYLIVLMYSWIVRREKDFMAMYDASDDKETFKSYIEPTDEDRSYTGFLRLHASSRPTAYMHFRQFYMMTMKLFIGSVLPIIVLPMLLFWRQWMWYLLGMLLSTIVLLTYETLIKKRDAHYYRRYIMGVVLKSYVKNPSQL